MATLREIKKHIAGVSSIQKITKAMKMVATAKLRRAQEQMFAARPYAIKLDDLLNRLVKTTSREAHPLLVEREPENVALVIVTSDRGLCGSFNSNIFRRTAAHIAEFKNRRLHFILLGRKGRDFFMKRHEGIIAEKINFITNLQWTDVEEISRIIIDHFLDMKLDRIDVLYNEFKNVAQQRIISEQLLPIEPFSDMTTVGTGVDYIFEPDVHGVLDNLLPMHVNNQIWRVLLESFASEQAARMTAMENATDNAEELISELTLQFNKARQAAITKELLEIVGGAEGLK